MKARLTLPIGTIPQALFRPWSALEPFTDDVCGVPGPDGCKRMRAPDDPEAPHPAPAPENVPAFGAVPLSGGDLLVFSVRADEEISALRTDCYPNSDHLHDLAGRHFLGFSYPSGQMGVSEPAWCAAMFWEPNSGVHLPITRWLEKSVDGTPSLYEIFGMGVFGKGFRHQPIPGFANPPVPAALLRQTIRRCCGSFWHHPLGSQYGVARCHIEMMGVTTRRSIEKHSLLHISFSWIRPDSSRVQHLCEPEFDILTTEYLNENFSCQIDGFFNLAFLEENRYMCAPDEIANGRLEFSWEEITIYIAARMLIELLSDERNAGTADALGACSEIPTREILNLPLILPQSRAGNALASILSVDRSGIATISDMLHHIVGEPDGDGRAAASEFLRREFQKQHGGSGSPSSTRKLADVQVYQTLRLGKGANDKHTIRTAGPLSDGELAAILLWGNHPPGGSEAKDFAATKSTLDALHVPNPADLWLNDFHRIRDRRPRHIVLPVWETIRKGVTTPTIFAHIWQQTAGFTKDELNFDLKKVLPPIVLPVGRLLAQSFLDRDILADEQARNTMESAVVYVHEAVNALESAARALGDAADAAPSPALARARRATALGGVSMRAITELLKTKLGAPHRDTLRRLFPPRAGLTKRIDRMFATLFRLNAADRDFQYAINPALDDQPDVALSELGGEGNLVLNTMLREITCNIRNDRPAADQTIQVTWGWVADDDAVRFWCEQVQHSRDSETGRPQESESARRIDALLDECLGGAGRLRVWRPSWSRQGAKNYRVTWRSEFTLPLLEAMNARQTRSNSHH